MRETGDFNSMPKLSSKIEGFTDSVIRRMTRIANSYGAINLSQGFPDFDPPVELKNALSRVAIRKHTSICSNMGC